MEPYGSELAKNCGEIVSALCKIFTILPLQLFALYP